MIIDDFNVVCISFSPNKTEAPLLVIDPDVALPLSVAVQGFQAISRRRYQNLAIPSRSPVAEASGGHSASQFNDIERWHGRF